MIVRDEPDRNLVPAEASGDRETAMGATQNDRAGAIASARCVAARSNRFSLQRHDDALAGITKLLSRPPGGFQGLSSSRIAAFCDLRPARERSGARQTSCPR